MTAGSVPTPTSTLKNWRTDRQAYSPNGAVTEARTDCELVWQKMVHDLSPIGGLQGGAPRVCNRLSNSFNQMRGSAPKHNAAGAVAISHIEMFPDKYRLFRTFRIDGFF